MSLPNAWSCLPGAFALALDMTLEEVIQEIGHDGSTTVFDGIRPWQSFHIAELLLVARKHGYACTPYDVLPVSTPDGAQRFPLYYLTDRIRHLISTSNGVMLGRGASTFHAVCMKKGIVHDPAGGIPYTLPNYRFTPTTFYLFDLIL